MFPARITILGGGTAGWLAALMLQDAAARANQACAITVIESSKFGTIGVGEGTTAVFRMMLRNLGLDEAEFLAASGATIKYGIRHRDWRCLGHLYDGPIDDPHLVAGLGAEPLLDAHQVAAGRPVGETHLFQHLIDAGRAPVAATAGGGTIPAGPFHHAFHFDQALAGKFLKSKARGITLIDDQVKGVEKGGDGIIALSLESGARVEADLFIDCSGFRRAIVSALGVPWVDYLGTLPVNRAMPFWLDIPEAEEIAPVTQAWAQGAGWLWKIPTQGRYGCGYVYSDAHIAPEAAKAEIETSLGHPIEPRNDIRIGAGRLAQSWTGNVVALGLSSSFLEPLEATSIHGTVVQLMLLREALAGRLSREAFNVAAARQVDDFRDFIRLHYVSERRDTPFWRDLADSHPQAIRDRVAHWKTAMPAPADFTPLPFDLPHMGHQLYTPVLDGLGLLSRKAARRALGGTARANAVARTAEALRREYRAAAAKCLSHRGYLTALAKEHAP